MTEALSGDDDLSALLTDARDLDASADPGRLLQVLVEAARTHTASFAGAFWRRDEGDGGLVLAVPECEFPQRLAAGDGLTGRCASSGIPLHVRNPGELGDAPDVDAIATRSGERPRAVLNLPLRARDGGVLGVLQLLHSRSDGFADGVLHFTQLLASLGALALQNAQLAASAQETTRLATEVEVARELQRSTLPTVFPEIPGYDVFGHFQPAEYAGGDLFDLVQLERGVFMLLGDAAGHGFGPALSAVQMQGMLRVAFRLGADLDQAFLHVNNQLAEDLPADRFLTSFMGFLDPATHTVSYHSPGQGPILHFHADGCRCEWHEPETFPIGIVPLDRVNPAIILRLEPGDILALISDGIYEQPDAAGEEFGRDRVDTLLQHGHALPMAELCRNLLAAVERFRAGFAQADDITLVLVRRLP